MRVIGQAFPESFRRLLLLICLFGLGVFTCQLAPAAAQAGPASEDSQKRKTATAPEAGSPKGEINGPLSNQPATDAANGISEHPAPCKVDLHYKPRRGKITVGCPKVWRSDRVFTVLDGLLRDVDSITVQALQDLDPNQVNATELIKLVTDFQAGVKFDQQAAINNSLERQRMSAERSRDLENFNADKSNNELVLKRKAELQKEKFDLQDKERDLAAKGQTDTTQEPLKSLKARQQLVDSNLEGLNSSSATIPQKTLPAGSATAPPTVTATNDSTAIPDSLTKVLKEGLQNPTLPASMRMDNVIELLHQRLSREFSVLYDDLSREAKINDIYLVQFDIGIVPFNGAKNRDARVELDFDDAQIQAYELYPGTSSYNILRGLDKTSRIGLSGMAQTVLGWGISASFSRQKNQLHSGLSQSLFVSGFGAGRTEFGWQIGASPFEDLITPGSRIVNAIILVPKRGGQQVTNLKFKARYCWPKQQTRYDFRGIAIRTAWFPLHTLGAPALTFGPLEEQSCAGEGERDEITMALPIAPELTIERISYNPTSLKETPGTQAPNPTDKPNTVQITFHEPVDPNLTITVADKLINRVRDIRGRALFGAKQETLAGTQNEQDLLKNSRFGILEKDTLGPDTWIQLNSKAILISLSRDTAGTDTFPTITLSDPGWGGKELLALANTNRSSATKGNGQGGYGTEGNWPEIRIGEWLFQNTRVPESAFLPLFTKPYQPGRIQVYVDEVDHENKWPKRLRIISDTRREGRSSPVWLHEQAQAVLVAKSDERPQQEGHDHWALKCDGEEGTLSCKFPAGDVIRQYPAPGLLTRFKIWIDEPPYYDRPGFWADKDIKNTDNPQPYAQGDWADVRELSARQSCDSCRIWDRWTANIRLKNLTVEDRSTNPPTPGKKYCIEELSEINLTLDKLGKKSGAVSKGRSPSKSPAENGPSDKTKQVERNLVNPLQNFEIAKDTPDTRGARDSKGAPETCGYSPLSLRGNRENESLTLEIPFEVLPALPQNLHLKEMGCSGPDCQRIALPELGPKLLPAAVRFTPVSDGRYHIEGDHLKAVDTIRLESPGQAPLTADPTIGFNSVDFFVEPSKLKEKSSYSVFAVISGITVPLYQENANKKLEQVTFTYERP